MKELIVAASKDGSFDNFLETGGEIGNIEAPTTSQVDKLKKTKTQYQELLNSGKIKDEKRKETIVQNIIDIDKQLKSLTSPKKENTMSESDLGFLSPGISPSLSKLRKFKTLKKKEGKKLTAQEARRMSLLEIFSFYSR